MFKEKGTNKCNINFIKRSFTRRKKNINLEISKSINAVVDFTYKTDKSLISGLRVQVGSLLIDTSISNKLKRIKQSMIEN